jgi:aryl-alcohol dehydrogenase-like predicted oxidoreductase
MEIGKEPPEYQDRCILGTAGLGGVWAKIDPQESVKAILVSLEQGIKAIDTAPAYGDAEALVGKAFRQWKGSLPLVSTKAGRLKSYSATEGSYDYSAGGLEKSVLNSLQVLKVPAIDVLFLHDPSAIPPADAEMVIGKMLSFKDKGYARFIGLGGNSPDWFKKYLTANVFDVVMEYNRLDACCLDALNTTLPCCQSQGMRFWAASPLRMGLLGNCFDTFTQKPPPWVSAADLACAARLQKIAAQNNLALPALAHRFLLSLPHSFNIVMGAATLPQLLDTLAAIKEGPLPHTLFTEIISNMNP